MASPFTNALKSAKRGGILILIVVWGQGCSPRYFKSDSVASALQCHVPVLPVSMDTYNAHYAMTLRQRRFFKNNIEETVLITDNSQLVSSGLLYFSDEEGDSRRRRWHRVDAWLQDRDGAPSGAPMPGQQVVLASSKGKLNHEGAREYELILVYTGQVVGPVTDTDHQPDALWRVRLERAWQITGSGKGHYIKPRHKGAVNLEVMMRYKPARESVPEHIEVYTLVDRSQNQIGVEKALIFDFRQIYGEPLWLIRNQ